MNRNIPLNEGVVNSQEEGISKPLYNNMGAVATKKGIEVLIDWCSFTIPHEYLVLGDVFEVLGIPHREFVAMPRGGNGYKSQLRLGDIAVFYHGAKGMGVHVVMTGQGCRQYEGRFGNRWVELFKTVFKFNGHFSRLDNAVDDFRDCFTVADIEKKVQKREVRCKFKTARGMTNYVLSEEAGKGEGKTVYFGSAQSDIQIRIYDKAAEQKVNFPWVRVEMQLRNERADVMVQNIIAGSENYGKIVSGALRNYVIFIEPSNDSNKARWPVSGWWNEFLGVADKVKLPSTL